MIKSRRMRWRGHVACMRKKNWVFVGKPGGKRPLGIPRCRWEDNAKIDLKRNRMGWNGLN
jgi:hypothetical protein